MNNSGINKTLWLSGLISGALIGAYLYKNKDEFGPQKEKLNKLIGEFQSIMGDVKTKFLDATSEGMDVTKTALKSAKDKVEKEIK